MGYDDRREIYERLEALERLVRSRSGEHGGWDEHRRGGRDRRDHGRRDHHDRGHRGGDEHDRDDRYRGRADGGFEEKRIIDTIVQLVGERLERFIQDQQAKTQRRDDGGREKQMIDLVVRLVGEHVREIVQRIVSNELDRRVGPPRDERQGTPPPPGEPKPE